ncbi:MAG: hypothetical protein L6Q49_17760, partial [Anaerolineales bacterium]|nr:hypothetical protein [Anaerolineales bacterium]
MGEDVIASIPVGMVIFLALILFASSVGLGWWLQRMQEQKREHDNLQSLLNAIPQAALIVDGEANILVKNTRASQIMNESGWEMNLPQNLMEAVGRVGETGLTERIEILTAKKKVQVLATPLHVRKEAQVLILITDSADGSYRAELYQQLVGTIAHELRTPLTAIMGHVEILNSCGMDEETLWRRSLGFVS